MNNIDLTFLHKNLILYKAVLNEKQLGSENFSTLEIQGA